jgi:hypothetical protein
MTSHRRALTVGLAAVATAAAIVPAAAATKAKAPAPLTVYPQTAECTTGQGSPTWALDTTASDANDGCIGFGAGINNGQPEGPRTDEDYAGSPRTHVRLAKSGSITGTIKIKAEDLLLGKPFAGAADVVVSLTINGFDVGSTEGSGPITPTADLAIPVKWAIPAALKGKKIGAMDLVVHWVAAGGGTFVDQLNSSLKLPRS